MISAFNIVLASLLLIISLQYYDSNGGYMTDQQQYSFRMYATQASQKYGSNISQNLKYITAGMDYDYGSRMNTYLISIQTLQTPSGWYIDTLYSQWITRKNITKINLTWTYFIGHINRTQYPQQYINKGKGSGITPQLQQQINTIISNTQSQTICRCSDVYRIRNNLVMFLGQKWSIICSANLGETYVYGGIRNQVWIGTKPRYCAYLVFMI